MLARQRISLFGGHRVREFKFKKNVWWTVVTGFDLDIGAVPVQQPTPLRRQGARHDKRR
jgi:hypothetical protein